MRGVIAAGSEHTASAGAEVLRQGGNAVDAAVAGCFATAAGEPTLTSLAGAGVLIHRDGRSGEVTLCDFFANTPGLGHEAVERAGLDFCPVELDFGPVTQVFYIGRGAAAVPGALPGLCTAHERWGRLPLSEVVAPACRLMREGVSIGPWQARAVKLLTPILFHTEGGRRQFGVADPAADNGLRVVGEQDRFRLPWLADTLEQLAAVGWRRFHREVLHPLIVEQFGVAAGGLLTMDDLEAFEVVFRRPLRFSYRGQRVFTNPPPGVGGAMIALMLSLLEGARAVAAPGSVERVRALSRVMQVADLARQRGGQLADEDGTALDPALLEPCRRELGSLAGQPLSAVPVAGGGAASTTHVSVIDGEGNAAAVTFSYGEGNGHLIGQTGIMMNNLMGEEDLHPAGFHTTPAGQRLSTMMSPSILVGPDGELVALGSGGANRIRTALVQVISNLVDHGLSPQQATEAARCHFEQGVLNAEVHQLADRGAALRALGAPEIVRFDEPNLFFGGVHLARRLPDGTLEGGGDPRRGGAVRVVE